MGVGSSKITPKAETSKYEEGEELQHMISKKLRKAEHNLNEHRRRTVERIKEHDKKIEEVREKFYSRQEDSESAVSRLGSYILRIENARAMAR